MNRSRTAGIVWLVAAVLSAATTIVFRGDSVWSTITLVASGVAAVIGVLLLRRPSNTSVLLSTIGGVAWVIMYVTLTAIQSDDIQAWTADAFFALLGGAAAVIAYRGSRQPAA